MVNIIRAVILSMMGLVCMAPAEAIPNYSDPINIIQNNNIFWSFGLNEETIKKLSEYPEAANELLEHIMKHTAEFTQHAESRLRELQPSGKKKNDPAAAAEVASYKKALKIINQAQQKAQLLLTPSTKLTEQDYQTLKHLIFSLEPEKLFDLDYTALTAFQTLQQGRIGSTQLQEKVTARVALEKRYQHYKRFLRKLGQREKLSPHDNVLIQRAKDALELAYHSLHRIVAFGAPSDTFIERVVKKNAQELFRLSPGEPEEEAENYVRIRAQQLRAYIAKSPPQLQKGLVGSLEKRSADAHNALHKG